MLTPSMHFARRQSKKDLSAFTEIPRESIEFAFVAGRDSDDAEILFQNYPAQRRCDAELKYC